MRVPVEHELVEPLGDEGGEHDLVLVEALRVALDVVALPAVGDGLGRQPGAYTRPLLSST